MKSTKDKVKTISRKDFMKMKAEEKRQIKESLKAAKEKAEREGRLNIINKLDDHQIVKMLLDHDDIITADFFFLKCRPLLLDIIGYVFGGRRVDYNEVVTEIYYYLMRPNTKGEDAAVLRSFQFRSSLYQWLKFVVMHFLIRNKQRLLNGNTQELDLPDDEAFNGPDDAVNKIVDTDDGYEDSPWAVVDVEIRRQEAANYIEDVFRRMVAEERKDVRCKVRKTISTC